MTEYYPAFLNLRGKLAVVIGGGEVARRKVESLVAAGATVRVVSPLLEADLERMARAGEVVVERRGYRPGDLADAWLAVAATSEAEVNQAVWQDARAERILVNVVDVPELCDFVVPSVLRRGDLAVAISTGGLSPSLARRIREKLEETLVPEYGGFLRLLGELRQRVRRDLPASEQRERFWRAAVDSDAFEIFRQRGEDAARQRLDEMMGQVRQGDR